MAHFIGHVDGARGPVSQLGTKNSGMRVVAASWNGAVKTTLYHDEATGKDYATIALIPWHGKGVSRILYDGPVDQPVAETNGRLSANAVKRADVNAYPAGAYEGPMDDPDTHAQLDAEADKHNAEIGFMVSAPDQGVVYADRDPVSTGKLGDR